MLEQIRRVLGRLSRSFESKAERAYRVRDQSSPGSHREAFAEGEAHAYGLAAEEAREAADAAGETT